MLFLQPVKQVVHGLLSLMLEKVRGELLFLFGGRKLVAEQRLLHRRTILKVEVKNTVLSK